MNIHSKIWFTCLSLIIIACGSPSPSSIEGKIENLPEYISEITLQTEKQTKNIQIDKNGVFKDTIHLKQSFAVLRIGSFGKMLFLDSISQLKITADLNDFDNTVVFEGIGAAENNYIQQREKTINGIFTNIDSVIHLDNDSFYTLLSNTKDNIESLLNNNIDPFLKAQEQENLTSFLNTLEQEYKTTNNTQTSLQIGSPSPEFTDLENYQGGTTSLKDLRGNYVYIDIWATWCYPCLQQIPYLQKLENEFHGKPIKFVSLSIDSPNAKSKWKQMVQEKNMGGIQLFAGGNIPFVHDYQITGIPRFILLDKKGNIVNADAPRPSDPNFRKYLNELVK